MKMKRFWMLKVALFLLSLAMVLSSAMAISDPVETAALKAFKIAQQDPGKALSNWQGNDPCGSPRWNGIYCNYTDTATNISYVTEIRAINFNLRGTLVPELGNLTHLLRLNVIRNHMSGIIPPSLGKLLNLQLFMVNSNNLTGSLPPELGNLSNMTRFQVDENQLSGTLPPTFGTLSKCKHLHMNNNSFTGSIPANFSQIMTLNHLILDNNQVTGPLPQALANIPSLTIIQLDNNPIGGTVPTQWTQIPSLLKLSLRNCSLTGTIPELSAMPNLTFIDLSYNNLTGGLPSNISSNLITIAFGENKLNGSIPDIYGSLNYLQALDFSNNNLTGSIPSTLGDGTSFTNASQFVLVNLQNNQLSGFNASIIQVASKTNKYVWLSGNTALCPIFAVSTQVLVCTSNSVWQLGDSYQSPFISGASCPSCSSPYSLVSNGSANGCRCALPVIVVIRLKSPSFTFFDRYVNYLEDMTASVLQLSAYQVQISKASRYIAGFRQEITLVLFPLNSTFLQSDYDRLFTAFASWAVSAGSEWSLSVVGPYDLLDFGTQSSGSSKAGSLAAGVIAGAVLGGVAMAAIVGAPAVLLILRHRRKHAVPQKSLMNRSELPPGINIKGVKGFSYEELAEATDNFSATQELGQGGYGKVYKGILEDGSAVAIKRAKEGSMQGAPQFYTEIELLSRVHHRNLLSLLGFCNDQGEQMLVYEFMAGGTLRDHLIPTEIMDFARRMHIALGTARGILYLHTDADPPIFHRDIKASNILLDERYNAKVADFGLSRLAPLPDLNGLTAEHVSTLVRGTPGCKYPLLQADEVSDRKWWQLVMMKGYLDPEYLMTNQLTDKSDVYSFGIVLLELLTGKMPISHGKNITREVTQAIEADSIMSIADPCMGPHPPEIGVQRLLKLALSCCHAETEERPRMMTVTRELEDIWRLTAPLISSSVKKDSDTFSIDMDLLGRKGSGEEFFSRDMSALSIETNDQTGELKSRSGRSIHPR